MWIYSVSSVVALRIEVVGGAFLFFYAPSEPNGATGTQVFITKSVLWKLMRFTACLTVSASPQDECICDVLYGRGRSNEHAVMNRRMRVALYRATFVSFAWIFDQHLQ